MDDIELNGLNVYQEANLEPDDGRAAIARVVKNRMARRYSSDGTIPGTVLWPDQFSWAYFGFKSVLHTGTGTHAVAQQSYVRVAYTQTQAANLAAIRLAAANAAALADRCRIAVAVMDGSYSGPLYDQLTDDVVLYCNPKILTKTPDWAIPTRLVCSIGAHFFFRG